MSDETQETSRIDEAEHIIHNLQAGQITPEEANNLMDQLITEAIGERVRRSHAPSTATNAYHPEP